ncbi:MAG TPA: carboxyltransferase domain-containing protein [Gemmatimonadales bacterium]|nr:carboxyltransferase domain-containing protein [Gemmatimonadales bacterium]
MTLEPFGDAALRARLPPGADRRALLHALRSLPRVIDAVVTESHAMVTFDPSARPDGVAETIAASPSFAAVASPAPRTHSIHVRYDGADLDEVAREAGLTRAEVIARHAAGEFVVSAIGFLPGFAYLRGLDPALVTPRRASPRPRVEALSVAIAGPYTGIYPFASPGGWHLLGRAVGFSPFDARSGAAMALGDRVVFVDGDK